MYLVAFCTMMLLLLESTIEEGIYYLLGISESFRAWVGLLISVLTGLAIGSFGTDLYLWHAEQKIRSEVDSKSVHIPEILIERIASRGGTSWYFLLGILALVVLAIVAANLVDLLEAF
jgi:hypothetical protein